jgi:hypothetical protein
MVWILPIEVIQVIVSVQLPQEHIIVRLASLHVNKVMSINFLLEKALVFILQIAKKKA